MAKLTIGKMANLYGLARTTLYDRIKAGTLSYEVNNQGQKVIDLSEMHRIYGEPKDYKKQNNIQSVSPDSSLTDKNTESYSKDLIHLYEEQIEFFKHQQKLFELREEQSILREKQAIEREIRYLDMFNELKDEIKTLKLALEYKPSSNVEDVSLTVNKNVSLTHNNTDSDKAYTHKKTHEPIKEEEEEPKKRGFLSRFFLPNG